QGRSARVRQLVWRASAIAAGPAAMGTQFNAHIKQIVFNTESYGPLIMSGRIDGIDRDLWQALKNQVIAPEHSEGPDTNALRTLYRLYLPPVLAAGPTFDVRFFSLTTPSGEVNGRLHIAIADDLQPFASLAGLVDQMRLEFRGRMPAAMLRRLIRGVAERRDVLDHAVSDADVEQALQSLLDKELIKPLADGQGYQLHVVVDHGQVRLDDHVEPNWDALLHT